LSDASGAFDGRKGPKGDADTDISFVLKADVAVARLLKPRTPPDCIVNIASGAVA